MKVDHSVTDVTKRSIGKQDITGQSAELHPEYAVGLVAVLEHASSPLQPTIQCKDQLRPKWPPVTMASTLRRSNSAAISLTRSDLPWAQRYSISTVSPSLQPSSRKRAVKAPV